MSEHVDFIGGPLDGLIEWLSRPIKNASCTFQNDGSKISHLYVFDGENFVFMKTFIAKERMKL